MSHFGSLIVFGLAWLATWALVRYVLSRIWPPRGYDRQELSPDPRIGWVTFRTTTSRGIWPWAPHIATAVGVAAAAIVEVLR